MSIGVATFLILLFIFDWDWVSAIFVAFIASAIFGGSTVEVEYTDNNTKVVITEPINKTSTPVTEKRLPVLAKSLTVDTSYVDINMRNSDYVHLYKQGDKLIACSDSGCFDAPVIRKHTDRVIYACNDKIQKCYKVR